MCEDCRYKNLPLIGFVKFCEIDGDMKKVVANDGKVLKWQRNVRKQEPGTWSSDPGLTVETWHQN